jgi:hypothetical protein
VLIIINQINASGSVLLSQPSAGSSPPPYVDVSQDNYIAPIDALLVINYINAHGPPGGGEGESETATFDLHAVNDELLTVDVASQSKQRRRLLPVIR